jgi:hypothetical protein
MPEPATEWHLSLTDSVYALGAAARELRAAHQHAHYTVWSNDPARLIPVVGLLNVTNTEPVRPHDEALWQLSDLYTALEHHAKELYENAALGYAHGAALAITSVLRSQAPHRVELARARSGRYVLPEDGLPDLSASISRRAGGCELADARGHFLEAEQAANAEPTDDAADLTEEFATDLANAACAYGECAEHVLHHLLRFAESRGFLSAS